MEKKNLMKLLLMHLFVWLDHVFSVFYLESILVFQTKNTFMDVPSEVSVVFFPKINF